LKSLLKSYLNGCFWNEKVSCILETFLHFFNIVRGFATSNFGIHNLQMLGNCTWMFEKIVGWNWMLWNDTTHGACGNENDPNPIFSLT